MCLWDGRGGGRKSVWVGGILTGTWAHAQPTRHNYFSLINVGRVFLPAQSSITRGEFVLLFHLHIVQSSLISTFPVSQLERCMTCFLRYRSLFPALCMYAQCKKVQ